MEEFETTGKTPLPFPKTGAIILGVVFLVVLGAYFGLNALTAGTKTGITDLQEENKRLRTYFASGISGESNVRTISQVIHLRDLIKDHRYPARTLLAIARNVPKNMFIDSLSVDLDKQILVMTATVNDLGGFAGALEAITKSSFFVGPQIEIDLIDFQKNSVALKITSAFAGEQ